LQIEEAMSLRELRNSGKHFLTPPINEDRVKRPRAFWDDSDSRKALQEERHDNCLDSGVEYDAQGNSRATESFPKQAQRPAARMICDNAYGFDDTVQLEISSTWHFRFKGSYGALLITLNTLPNLERALSRRAEGATVGNQPYHRLVPVRGLPGVYPLLYLQSAPP